MDARRRFPPAEGRRQFRGRRPVRRDPIGGGPAPSRFLLIPLACVSILGGYLVWVRISDSLWPHAPSGGRSPRAEREPAALEDGEPHDVSDPAEGLAVDDAPQVETRDVAETYGDAASSPTFEVNHLPSDVDATALAVESSQAVPAAPASKRPKDSSAPAARKARAKGVVPPADGKPASAPGKSNIFTLVLEGKLGTKPLPANDPQTWARLGCFLLEEASRRFFLVFPGGSIPLVVPSESAPQAKAKPEARGTKKPADAPAGDPAFPEYRLVLRAASHADGAITFYGKSMASKYRCDISCSIERRSGDSFRQIDKVSVSERWTPSSAQKVDGSDAVRKVYDVCLDRLVKSLAQRPLFAGK